MQSIAAEQVVRALPEDERRLNPTLHTRVQGVGRDIAVAKFRELANKIESGELDGARCQWGTNHGLDTETEMVTVTLTTDTVQMITTKIEEV